VYRNCYDYAPPWEIAVALLFVGMCCENAARAEMSVEELAKLAQKSSWHPDQLAVSEQYQSQLRA